MHSVDHHERLPLDGRWRFQLLRTPDDEPGTDWSEADVPGLWTMAGTWDLPALHERPDALRGPAAGDPGRQPDGRLRARVRGPRRGWAGRRVVLHVGAAESVLIVSLNGDEVGVGKDSHLASEFDLTGRLRPGSNTLRLRVVKWSDATYVEDQDQWWHGGITRSVFLYATRDVYLADVRVDAGLADDLSTGTLDLTVTVGFPGRELPPGWTVEAALEGIGRDAAAAAASSIDRPDPRRAGPATISDVMYRHAVGPPAGRGRAPRGTSSTPDGAAARRPRHLARRRPGRPALVRRAAGPATRCTSSLRAPGRRGRRGGHRPGRLPAGRDRRARPAGQRRPGLHPRRQPPRLRPAHRAGHLAARRCAPTSS